MFRFACERALWLLGLVPCLGLFFLWAFRMKRKAMARFGDPILIAKLSRSVSRKRQVLKTFCVLFAFLFLIIALARPQFGTKLRTVKREGQDLFIAIDVSLSMAAEDITPNRLEKAKHAVNTLIDRLQGDRVGLIVFAGKAFVQCPLTLDYGACKMFLDHITTDLVPTPGTAIAEAIQKACQGFVETERKHKVLILITDGEDHEGKPVEAAKEAAREGVVIYTVGIGSPEGVPIPLYDERGNRIGYKKDREGRVVMSRLDEATLQKIALETGGKYYRATPGEMELTRIYDEILQMEKKTLSSREFAQFEERFQPFLGLGLLLLVFEWLLPERRKVKEAWRGRFE